MIFIIMIIVSVQRTVRSRTSFEYDRDNIRETKTFERII